MPTPSSGGGQLQAQLDVYFDGREEPIPLDLCGTGIEQMLSLAVAVLTASEPRLILIDEPQAYLHPHAERSMLGLLEGHPEHQFIVATHSHTLLGSQPLRRARLLSLDSGHTRVARVEREQAALEELGVTAADLWLVDRLLWVEGPSEERVFELLARHRLTDAERSTLGIRRMPDVARVAARSAAKADAAYRFCAEVARAIAPVAVQMRFEFDMDNKSEELGAQLEAASGERTAFLPVRELENLFLEPRLLYRGLATLCEQAGIDAPSEDAVATRLNELLGRHDDRALYPEGPPSQAQDPSIVVKGSLVLRGMWWDLVHADYDKVADGERLARESLSTGGDELAPLADILDRLR